MRKDRRTVHQAWLEWRSAVRRERLAGRAQDKVGGVKVRMVFRVWDLAVARVLRDKAALVLEEAATCIPNSNIASDQSSGQMDKETKKAYDTVAAGLQQAGWQVDAVATELDKTHRLLRVALRDADRNKREATRAHALTLERERCPVHGSEILAQLIA